jgi:hypothetical protein
VQQSLSPVQVPPLVLQHEPELQPSPLQHSLAVLHESPPGEHSAHEPFWQMFEQQSLASVQVSKVGLQVEHSPSLQNRSLQQPSAQSEPTPAHSVQT